MNDDAASFKDLDTKELREAATAFAVDSDEVIAKSNAVTLRAALAENGVTWKMYMDMFHPAAEENTVKSEDVAPTKEEVGETVIITKEEKPVLPVNEQYLIKMVRENPLFEIAGFRFTQDHPYVLMNAAQAQVVLQEDGFRQAHPAEVQEFYG